jgi:hypothetical protein
MPTKARRGYRSITVHIPVAEYGTLEGIAAENFRSIEQQASAMLTADLKGAEEMALQEAVLRREGENGRPQQRPGLVDEIDGNGEWEEALERSAQ